MRSYNIIKQLRELDALVLDVDGVLTPGGIFYLDGGDQFKRFDVKDGLGAVAMGGFGVRIAIITGKRSEIVARRAAEIGVEDLYQGYGFKVPALEDFIGKHDLDPARIGFVGDDIIDIPAMELCGFSACPADAAFALRRSVDWVTRSPGGYGALREIAEMIISAKSGQFPADSALLEWARKLEGKR